MNNDDITNCMGTECREDMVQHICDAFLNGSLYSPDDDHFTTERVKLYNGHATGFISRYGYNMPGVDKRIKYTDKIRGCEMKAAFKMLLDSGYFMYVTYKNRSRRNAKYYGCTPVPRVPNISGSLVKSFDDVID